MEFTRYPSTSLAPVWVALSILATVFVLTLGCGQRQEPTSQSSDGILMACGEGVHCTDPCFCERTCILWWCWGKPYCECRS